MTDQYEKLRRALFHYRSEPDSVIAQEMVTRRATPDMVSDLLAERDALAQDAARWRHVRRYMRLDDVGDEKFCLGLVINSDALEHAVTMQSARLYAERAVAAWEDVRGPEDSPKDLPPVTLEDAIDAAVADREAEG